MLSILDLRYHLISEIVGELDDLLESGHNVLPQCFPVGCRYLVSCHKY